VIQLDKNFGTENIHHDAHNILPFIMIQNNLNPIRIFTSQPSKKHSRSAGVAMGWMAEKGKIFFSSPQ
jgi:hypothetical protein